jgi:hypothetical protein
MTTAQSLTTLTLMNRSDTMHTLNEHQLLALRLIGNGWGTKLTSHGNVLVSAQAQSLQRAGLIVQEPRRWIGYQLTAAGRTIVAT